MSSLHHPITTSPSASDGFIPCVRDLGVVYDLHLDGHVECFAADDQHP